MGSIAVLGVCQDGRREVDSKSAFVGDFTSGRTESVYHLEGHDCEHTFVVQHHAGRYSRVSDVDGHFPAGMPVCINLISVRPAALRECKGCGSISDEGKVVRNFRDMENLELLYMSAASADLKHNLQLKEDELHRAILAHGKSGDVHRHGAISYEQLAVGFAREARDKAAGELTARSKV